MFFSSLPVTNAMTCRMEWMHIDLPLLATSFNDLRLFRTGEKGRRNCRQDVASSWQASGRAGRGMTTTTATDGGAIEQEHTHAQSAVRARLSG